MKNYVVWSGGCDSTALLHDLACCASHSNPVTAISNVSSLIDQNKNINEAKARDKLKRRFKKDNLPIKYIETNYSVEGDFNLGNSYCSQPFLWFAAVLPLLDANACVNFGYVSGDSAILNLLSLKEHFEEISKIACLSPVEIKFPYVHYEKSGIIGYLHDNGLYDLTWYCETPEKKNGPPCGTCTPCITHDVALYRREKHKKPMLGG